MRRSRRCSASSPRAASSCGGASAQRDAAGASTGVFLDDVRRPHARRVRIAPGYARRAALPQQIPALVELDLDRLQALLLLVRQRLLAKQLVLFGDEAFDVSEDLTVVFHACLSRSRGQRQARIAALRDASCFA